MSAPRLRAVLWDMDGTLLRGRVIEALARTLGYWDETVALFQSYRDGQRSAKEVSDLLAERLRDVPVARIRDIAGRVPLATGAREVIDDLHGRGVRTAILSDSYTLAVEVTAQRLGVPHVLANGLACRGPVCRGVLEPGTTGRFCDEACVQHSLCKKEGAALLAERLGVPLEACAMVGDGEPDMCAFRHVAFSVAYRASPPVKAAASAVVDEPDLRAVLRVLDPLLPPRPR